MVSDRSICGDAIDPCAGQFDTGRAEGGRGHAGLVRGVYQVVGVQWRG